MDHPATSSAGPEFTSSELDVLKFLASGAAWVPDKPEGLVHSQCVALAKKGLVREVEAVELDRYWRGWRWGETLESVALRRFEVDAEKWEKLRALHQIPAPEPVARPAPAEDFLFPGAPQVDGAEIQILKLFSRSGPTWVSSRSPGRIFERCAGLVKKAALEEVEVTRLDQFLVGMRADERVQENSVHRLKVTALGEKMVAAAGDRHG